MASRKTARSGVTLMRGVARATLTVSVCGLVAGCSEPSRCDEVENTALADDEPTPEGLTALEVLAMTASPHMAPFRWRPDVSNAVHDGSITVTVTVERTSAPARNVITEQSGDHEDDLNCGPSLHVPVLLRLTTSDGALDEVFEEDLVSSLHAAVDPTPTFAVKFDFDDLNGWLEPIATDRDGELSIVFGDEQFGNLAAASDGRAIVETVGEWGTAP